MTILSSDDRRMFTVFTMDEHVYMNVAVGGVAQYEVTVRLSEAELAVFGQDPNLAIALATHVATRTSAYENRIVRPSIDPV